MMTDIPDMKKDEMSLIKMDKKCCVNKKDQDLFTIKPKYWVTLY